MASRPDNNDPELASRLLQRLAAVARVADPRTTNGGMRQHGAGLFSYCAFTYERLARVVSETPRIGIVLSGAKEFWLADSGQRYIAGDVFCLPAGVPLDVVNIPSETSGVYESMLVDIHELPRAVLDLPGVRHRAAGFDLKVPLTEELVEALGHAATSLAGSGQASVLAEHRLAEVLILLRNVPQAAVLFEQSLVDRVTWVVLAQPTRTWTADSLGRELGMAGSTLRRRLASAGTSLREVMVSARMRFAYDLLTRGGASAGEAAVAAGYSSRSHFLRQFRSVHGVSPGEVVRG